jgi:hypothetical protein
LLSGGITNGRRVLAAPIIDDSELAIEILQASSPDLKLIIQSFVGSFFALVTILDSGQPRHLDLLATPLSFQLCSLLGSVC